MTRDAFNKLPLLLSEAETRLATGVARSTLRKWVDCGLLLPVKPEPAMQTRYQKRQVALLLRWPQEPGTDTWLVQFAAEKGLLTPKSVMFYTGYTQHTLEKLHGQNGGYMRLAGDNKGHWRKIEVAKWVGWEELV